MVTSYGPGMAPSGVVQTTKNATGLSNTGQFSFEYNANVMAASSNKRGTQGPNELALADKDNVTGSKAHLS